MLSESGCRARRERFWSRLPSEVEWAVLADPASLIYFADFCPSPFVFNSQGATALLILGRDGSSILVADNVQESFAGRAHVAERVLPVWYRCVEAAGHRGKLVADAALERLTACAGSAVAYERTHCPAAIVEGLRSSRPAMQFVDVDEPTRQLRRAKEPDEVDAIREALRVATEALHSAMWQLKPGMTELDAYRLVHRAAGEAAGRHVLVYGDFVSGPRCENGGGPPSHREIEPGDLVLLDFSVVLDGYRGDFCNTFVCGDRPNAQQVELFEACRDALDAGEQTLRPGVSCRDVYRAVRDVLARRNLADRFPHHAGHGIGLSHPEAPYLVPESTETLAAGDLVTLEPGVYIPGAAGMRYERNYLITPGGHESLSQHKIAIDATA